MRASLLLILFLTLAGFQSAHKYYLSLTQIDYNEKSKALQITMNVFIDDFELTLNNTYDKLFNLHTEKELEDSQVYIEKYLNQHFKVQLEGQAVKYNYIGRRYEADVIYLYLEIENVDSVKEIGIENTVLIEFFETQKNLIKLKINDKFDSLMLTKKKIRGLLNF